MTSTVTVICTCLLIIAAVVVVYIFSLARDEAELTVEEFKKLDEALEAEIAIRRQEDNQLAKVFRRIKTNRKVSIRRQKRASRASASRKSYR